MTSTSAKRFLVGTSAEAPGGNDWTYIRTKFPAFDNYPWHVGGDIDGRGPDDTVPNNENLFTNTVHLSTRDLSALANGFTLINLGGSHVEKMIFGDAVDAEIVKISGAARVRDSAFRDDVIATAHEVYVEGDVQALADETGDPNNDKVHLDINAELLHIRSKNINNEFGGLDSGIKANQVNLLGVTDRIVADGWIKTDGDIFINIPEQ